MAFIQKGRGVIWSTGDITFTGAIASATAAHFNQSLNIQRTSEHKNIMDHQGVNQSSIYYGFMKTITITVVPAALSGTNTLANAIASADSWTPKAGGVLTVVDPNSAASAPAVTDGAWNIVSTRQGRTVDGVATVDIELEAGDDGVDITTTVTP